MEKVLTRLATSMAVVCSAALAGQAYAQETKPGAKAVGFEFGVPVQKPFVCENDAHKVDLTKLTGEPCQAAPVVDYVYRNTEGKWLPFDPAGARPTDIAETTTSKEAAVPLIARREVGKASNGSTYVIGMLHDPAGGQDVTPGTRPPGWNGKLIMAYGGGVQANFHSGRGCGLNDELAYVNDGGGMGFQDLFMERGYATACGSLMVMGTNNDDVKSAETTARVKERFTEIYGEPDATIGVGPSGGSMQQLLIANNYPGLLDGIIPKRLYPDGISFLQPLHDGELLVHAFQDSGTHWTDRQKTAVSGYATFAYAVRNGARYPNLRPENCDAAVIDAITFDPQLSGVRCTYQDNMAYVYGTKPVEGALDAVGKPSPQAARPVYDNVGVQYGLKALNDGVISFDQFVELNTGIGGFDINGKITEARSVADEEAVKIAYETGRIVAGGAGLAEIPILDVRRWRDIPMAEADPTDLDVHDASHSRALRERLKAANGHADNHVIVIAADSPNRGPGTPIAAALSRGLANLDEWIDDIKADTREIPQAEKVVANKPEDMVDACYLTGQLRVTNTELCSATFPYASHPRIVAGGPLTEDIIKCQLKPVDAADYTTAPTSAQMDQLKKAFPEGVCDYSKPGVGQVPLAGTWISYMGDGKYEVRADAR